LTPERGINTFPEYSLKNTVTACVSIQNFSIPPHMTRAVTTILVDWHALTRANHK